MRASAYARRVSDCCARLCPWGESASHHALCSPIGHGSEGAPSVDVRDDQHMCMSRTHFHGIPITPVPLEEVRSSRALSARELSNDALSRRFGNDWVRQGGPVGPGFAFAADKTVAHMVVVARYFRARAQVQSATSALFTLNRLKIGT